MAAVGTVGLLVGRVVAEDALGNQRDLAIGDEIQEGEQIITTSGSRVEIRMLTGDNIVLQNGQSWTPTSETFTSGENFATNEAVIDPAVLPTGTDQNLSPEDIALQEALLAGADPTQLGDATAAGGAPGAGTFGAADGGGTSFVRNERTAGELDPSAGYNTIGTAGQQFSTLEETQILQEPLVLTPVTEEVIYTLQVVATDIDGIELADSAVFEGDTAYYKVKVINAATGDEVTTLVSTTVDVVFNDIDAINGVDYNAAPLNVLVGDVFSAEALDDIISDDNEQFNVSLVSDTVVGDVFLEADIVNVSDTPVITTINDETPPDEVILQVIATDVNGTPIVGEHSVSEGKTAYYKVIAIDPFTGEAIANPEQGSVIIDFEDVTATGGEDYVAQFQTVNINEVFSADTLDDFWDESSETFNLSIRAGSASGAIETAYEKLTESPDSLTTTITDENEDVVFAVIDNNGSVEEGDPSSFTVKLVDKDGNPVQVPAGESVTVTVSFGGGTATSGDDYNGTTQSVVILGGNSSETFTVETYNNSDTENETFIATIDEVDNTAVSGGNLFERIDFEEGINVGTPDAQTPTAEAEILDDAVVNLLINNVSVTEDDDYAQFTVSLSAPSTEDVTFDLSLIDGVQPTGAQGEGVDYGTSDPSNIEVSTDGVNWAPATTATINAGDNQLFVRTPITDDNLAEDPEIFTLQAANITNTANATATGQGTISDEPIGDPVTLQVIATDATGTPIVGPHIVDEGEQAYYKVIAIDDAGNAIDNPATGSVTVSFANGTTEGMQDFDNRDQTVDINQVFSTQTIEDYLSDDLENFQVTIVPNSAVGDIATAYEELVITDVPVNTVIDDETDGSPPPGEEDTVFAVISNQGAVEEGEDALFTVRLVDKDGNPVNVPAGETVEVTVSFGGGSAETGDYDDAAKTVIITGGNSSAELEVTTIVDADSDDENFNATISAVDDSANAGGNIFEVVDFTNGIQSGLADEQTPTAVGEILDGASPPRLKVSNVSVDESDDYAVFTVSLSKVSASDVSFDLVLEDGVGVTGAEGEGVDFGANDPQNLQVSTDGTNWQPATSAIITAGDSEIYVRTPVVDDYLAEDTEQFSLVASNISNTANTQAQGIGSINDEPIGDEVTLKIIATDENGTPITDEHIVNESEFAYYKVIAIDPDGNTIENPEPGTISVGFNDVSTQGSDDFDNRSQTVVINEVFSTKTYDDNKSEGDEQFEIGILPNTAAGKITDAYEELTVSTDKVITTITDEPEDAVFAVISNQGPVDEGTESRFTVSLVDMNGDPVVVQKGESIKVTVNFENGTADGEDYVSTTQTVTISENSSSVELTVATNEDRKDEDDETFIAKIASVDDSAVDGGNQFEKVYTTVSVNPDTANEQTPTATATIQDVYEPPVLSIVGETVDEDAGFAEFTVSISDYILEDVTFDLALVNGTAEGSGVDFGSLGADNLQISLDNGVSWVNGIQGTIAAGETSILVRTPVVDDLYDENLEDYTLKATNITNTENLTAEGLGQIIDEPIPDTVYAVISNEGPVVEGGKSYFTVSLVDKNGEPVIVKPGESVNVSVDFSDNSSEAEDFDHTAQTVTITAGTSSAQFFVQTNTDGDLDDELFTANITDVDDSKVGGGVQFENVNWTTDVVTSAGETLTPSAEAEIIDNDLPVLSIVGETVDEDAGFAEFTVSLSEVSTEDVTFDLALADGSADGGGVDFGSLDADNLQISLDNGVSWIDGAQGTIAAGETSILVRTPVVDDLYAEGLEDYMLKATSITNTENLTAEGLGQIIDDDDEVTIKVIATDADGNPLAPDVKIPEGDKAYYKTIAVDPAGIEVPNLVSGSVNINFDNVTTGNPEDLARNTIRVNVGEVFSTQTFEDSQLEGDETFTVTIEPGSLRGPIIAAYEKVGISDEKVTSTIKDVKDVPDLASTIVAVSEEGLISLNANPDGIGNPEGTNDAQSIGTITFTDAFNGGASEFSIKLEAPTDILKSGGEIIQWTPTVDGLIGHAGGEEIIRVVVGSVAEDATQTNGFEAPYTVTLSGPVDHPDTNSEDGVDLTFGVIVEEQGGTDSEEAPFTVTIQDDSPIASDHCVSVNVPTVDTNLMLVLDVSGSMNNGSGVYYKDTNGYDVEKSRLDLAKESIAKMIAEYDDLGDVKVRIVTFDVQADAYSSVWVNADSAINYISSLDKPEDQATTNYDAALGLAMDAFNDDGAIDGAQNISYFLSDGLPNRSDGDVDDLQNTKGGNYNGKNGNVLDNGVQGDEETQWVNFLKDNDINSISVAMGAGSTSGTTDALDPIAYDASGPEVNTSTTIAEEFSDLNEVLQETINVPVVQGSIIENVKAGADGFDYIKSVTVDNVVYHYDEANPVKVIDAGDGAIFTLDMSDGSYSYKLDAVVTTRIVENISFTIVDKDGDGADVMQTFKLQINPNIESAPTGTNVLIMLDTSGSMGDPISKNDSTSRLEAAKKAIDQLLDQYSVHGNVKVQLGFFNQSPVNASGTAWLSIYEAKQLLDAITETDGGTNYDYALSGIKDLYNTDGKLVGAQTVSYFLSDGEPTYSDKYPDSPNDGSTYDPDKGDGIDTNEQKDWEDFLKTNEIVSHSIGIGEEAAGLTSLLAPIAYNGDTQQQTAPLVVENIDNLAGQLQGLIETPNSITYKGTQYDDTINAANSDDVLYGGAGNDILSGGQGNDLFFGEEGADVFTFMQGDKASPVEEDTIADFSMAEGDKIDLSDILSGENDANIGDYMTFILDGNDTVIELQSDGGNVTDHRIRLTNVDLVTGAADHNDIVEALKNSLIIDNI
jgi:hypothetical protein